MTEQDIKRLLPECLLHSKTYSLVITDLEGCYIFVNDTFKHRFSFLSDNFIGQSSFVAIHPDDHALCLQAVRQCLATPDQVVQINLRKPDTPKGDFYATSWEFSVLKDVQKNPIGILCLGHDISETEKASREAKIFAQKAETIIEEITDGFYQLDNAWRFVKINKVAEKILGLPREQLLGRVLWEVFPDDSACNYPIQLRKALQESIIVTFEDYRPDLERWFSTVCYPSLEGLTVFFKDISQEKADKEKLKDSENKLKAILDSTQDSNLFISPEKKIISFNKTANQIALSLWQKPLKIDAYIQDFLPPESINTFQKLFPKALQGESIVLEIERVLKNQKVWFEVTYLPVYDQNGNVLGVTINTKNIQEKKQAILALQEKEYMLRAIYQSTSEASTFIDKNFVVRYSNHVAKQITKQLFGKEEVVGDNVLEYVLPEYKEEFEAHLQDVIQGKSISVERYDGRHWWQISLYPVFDEQQQIMGIAHNVKDISERKYKEAQILQQNEQLRAIAWQHSHELRRPLANVLGLCDLLKEAQEEAKRIEYIEYLLQEAAALDALIHTIVAKANTITHKP
jgi:PAS domain S-box-containing protein